MTIKVESASAPVIAADSSVQAIADKSATEQVKAEPVETSDESETSKAEHEVEAEEKEDELEGESENEADESQPKKPLKGFKKKIDRLTKGKTQAEQERDYWREQALQNKKVEEKHTPKVDAVTDDRPRADDFETHEEFVEKLAEWKFDQKQKEAEAKEKNAKAKSEFDSKVTDYSNGVKAITAKYDDYDDVIESVDDIPMPVSVSNLLLKSKNGPELSYLLAKNRDEFARICKLHPDDAAYEIGKFEAANIKAQEKKSENKTTKAPAPISPIGSVGSAVVKKSIADPNLSQREYEALRAKQSAKSA